jgi:hypothetical protein
MLNQPTYLKAIRLTEMLASTVIASSLLTVSAISTPLRPCLPCWAAPQASSPQTVTEGPSSAKTKGKPAALGGKMTTKSVLVTGEKAAQQSYGENIDQANLIVSADYQESGSILVKKVLKGDKSWLGKTIKLANPIKMGCRQQSVPSIKNAAVLLQSNSKKEFNVVEIYDTPDQIAFLNCFVPIYANTSKSSPQTERIKLTALSKLFTGTNSNTNEFEVDPTPTFKKEFLCALGTMKQPENFELVKELYLRPSLSAKDKLSLQEWMANTGDKRVIPVLYQALKSNDKFINSDAVSRLTYNYQSPETDKAIAEAYNSLPAGSQPMADRYLIKRGANKLVKSPGLMLSSTAASSTPNTFQKASELERQGKTKEAQALYLSVLESKEDNTYAIPVAINKVLDGEDGRTKVIQSRLPWLNKFATNSNYLEAQDAALILRRLKNADCLEALMAILQKRQSIFSKADQTATFAIVELGASARKRATKELLKEIESNPALAQKSDEQTLLLLELAWLQQSDDKQALSKLVETNNAWLGSYSQLQPLLSGLPSQDEGLFLVQKLKEQKLPPQALDWIIFRLGDLKETRAIEALMVEFEKPYSFSPATAKEALEKIAKNKQARETIAERLKKIALNSSSVSQANAIELLAAIEGDKSLPVVRQIIRNGQLDAKVRALNIISRLGQKQDLAILLPMSNYWTGDRRLHYWVMQAIGELNNK